MNIQTTKLNAALTATATCLSLLLAGCAGMTSTATPVAHAGSKLQGKLYGGQQPVAGAAITLYAASTTGYGGATSNILTAAVSTDGGGNFGISGDYACMPGQQMYIVATGGNPGAGTNANLALMAALGDCVNLTPQTFININEITTVAAVYALSPFMNSYTNLGSSSTNTAGLARAFTSAAKLANTSNGQPGGPSLAAGAVLPTAELNTLANILAACVNSTGGTAGANNACGTLFTNTTINFGPGGKLAPTNTISAILNIAQNPTSNVSNLYSLSSPTAPFQPQLASAPNDWTVSINYTLGGFSAPAGITADAAGTIYVPNSGNNTVSVLAQTGTAGVPLLLNGLSGPSAVAIDSHGNAWVTNKTGNSVSAFSPGGNALAGSPFTGSGNLSGPVALAFDAPGNLFIANSTGNSVTQLTSGGNYVQQITTGVTAPNAIAVNPN